MFAEGLGAGLSFSVEPEARGGRAILKVGEFTVCDMLEPLATGEFSTLAP
jgi:hypothetical protein